jgi:cilia- and flagella-associated protein 251
VQLNNGNHPINILTTHYNYLVCGNYEGTIRFYDFNFKIVAWFEDCLFSNVKSISFSQTEPKPCTTEVQQEKDDEIFMCSDFLVADENALICMLQSMLFEEIEPAKKKGYTIMHGIKSSISAIAVHPDQSLLAIAGADGFILLWDYLKKGDPMSNYENFHKETKESKGKDFKYYTLVEFTPDGQELLVAQWNGDIKILDIHTCLFKKLNTALKTTDRATRYPITQMIISPDGKYFAVCDTNCAVSLFKKDHINGDPNKPVEWQFNGKIKSHEIGVSSIAFGNGLDESGNPMHRLFSIGKDRRMFEYDVYASAYHDKLPVINHFYIEQEALPTSCIWYPKKDSKEGLLLTSNNDYKMKVWNPSA